MERGKVGGREGVDYFQIDYSLFFSSQNHVCVRLHFELDHLSCPSPHKTGYSTVHEVQKSTVSSFTGRGEGKKSAASHMNGLAKGGH